MTVVVGAHGKTADLEFIVLCTDSRGTVAGQPPMQVQKIYRAGDFFVTGAGDLNLVKMAADYADRVSITPRGIDSATSDVVGNLNRYLREEIPPKQLEELEGHNTCIVVAGPERTGGGMCTGLALFSIGWQDMLRGQEAYIPQDYVIAGSGKFAVEARQSGKNWAPPTGVQGLGGAILDAHYKAIVAERDPGVDGDKQFAIQVFRQGKFSKHLLLPQVLVRTREEAADYLKLFLGKTYSDRTITTQDDFRTEAAWTHAFYELLVNQLASIDLHRPKLRSPAEADTSITLGNPVQYEKARKELPETLSALASGDLPLIKEAVNSGAAYVNWRLREQLGIKA